MKIQIFSLSSLLIFTLWQPVFASMESAHHSIPTTVISGGGTPMASANFQTNATLGQPSPVTQAFSSNYEILPGFWQTLIQPGCLWDFIFDDDVDGLDIYEFIEGIETPGYNNTDLRSFSLEFGRTDCTN